MIKASMSRVALWAATGLLVSLGWALYFANADKGQPIDPFAYALAMFTQPAAALALSLKLIYRASLTWVAVGNAATYSLLGLVVETIRSQYRARRHLPV